MNTASDLARKAAKDLVVYATAASVLFTFCGWCVKKVVADPIQQSQQQILLALGEERLARQRGDEQLAAQISAISSTKAATDSLRVEVLVLKEQQKMLMQSVKFYRKYGGP